MSESVNIKRGDLHLAICGAFNRGRYELLTGGDGEPLEIVLDLRDRPDDLFDAETVEFDGVTSREQAERLARAASPFHAPRDDHGPAIPAQGQTGPVIYEFALQDADQFDGIWLGNVTLTRAPDVQAAQRADWVHVFDRVTRERRTLKRPAESPIVQGLRDVAADLRAR
jgi:hypothetical protein